MSSDDYYCSPEGMKNLTASCMLIEAIGEGVKQIDKITEGKLLTERSEIPWQDILVFVTTSPMAILILMGILFLMLSKITWIHY